MDEVVCHQTLKYLKNLKTDKHYSRRSKYLGVSKNGDNWQIIAMVDT